MNDITGVINCDSKITRVNITRVRAREPVSYPDSKPLFYAHVKRGYIKASACVDTLVHTSDLALHSLTVTVCGQNETEVGHTDTDIMTMIHDNVTDISCP